MFINRIDKYIVVRLFHEVYNNGSEWISGYYSNWDESQIKCWFFKKLDIKEFMPYESV